MIQTNASGIMERKEHARKGHERMKRRLISLVLVLMLVMTAGCGKKSTTKKLKTEDLDETTLQGMAKDITKEMSLKNKIGQLFMVSVYQLDETESKNQTSVTSQMKKTLKKYPAGGVIMFAKNINTPDQTKKMTDELQDASYIPLFMAVDEEGGQVSRVASNPKMKMTVYPSAQEVGRTYNNKKIAQMGKTQGKELKELGHIYGYDISRPAQNVQEAIQWLYFGYLAAIKEQNGAAMSLGRTSTFLDIYAERDLKNGTFTEEQIQEFIDHFIMKLRLVKFARTPEYNALFSGDPTWVTESIAGMGIDGRHMVTKMSYRYLHTLENLGTAPEPNLTVLWSTRLPQNFKRFCAKTSIASSSIQYENDDLMRVTHGDDYAIACCVSSMKVGKEMQFFGARANLAKCLLYAINGGVDEISKKQVGPKYRPITSEYLDYEEVMERFQDMMKWLACVYVNTLNIIHYMHDKYSYERLQMALHDKKVTRWFATGIAGLSVVADSLSAIKYAKVKPIRDENGIAIDYEIEGDFPKYGNDDDRVDDIAYDIVHQFMQYIKGNHTYRNGIPTTSILTITSNVVYGKATGSTPDGRKAGQAFAPGANPMHHRDRHGAVASLNSVSKLPFKDAQDGISNTFSIIPGALGKDDAILFDDITFELEPDCACCEPNAQLD